MTKHNLPGITLFSVFILAALTGCVERQLTINTNPEGALVVLNDEEIGLSPVTVNFNWYGDYCVRITRKAMKPSIPTAI